MDNRLTGAFISRRRKELSLNQKQLAEKLNVTDKAVSKWETGRSAPDISMLMPLSEALGVSVVEILRGERLEEEKLSYASDEAVVNAMEKGKREVYLAVLISICIMLFTVLFCIASYVGYHYFGSIPVSEGKIIEECSECYDDYVGKAEIVKSVKKGDYYFFLLRYDNGVVLRQYERDKLFKNRITFPGSISVKEKNKVEQYCFGQNGITINAFIGYGMTDDIYSYFYRGVECTKKIEGEYILDVLIDIDDTFSHASIIYNG